MPGVCWRCVHALKDPAYRPDVPRKGMTVWSCGACLTERFYPNSYTGARLCWKCAGLLHRGSVDRCAHCGKPLGGEAKAHRKKCESLLVSRIRLVRLEWETLRSMTGTDLSEPVTGSDKQLLRRLMSENAAMRRMLKDHASA
jgi:hypothetical protein